MDPKKKQKDQAPQAPTVAYGEIRAIGTEGDEKGIVEAYLTKWDSVDSYGTRFLKGAFEKSFKKRGTKGIRLIWNHQNLAGKILEMREDSYGPFVKAKFNLDTEAGRTAYSHVKEGDVNCFSFGFNTIKDNWSGQVRDIQEVDVLECGPVIFEANSKAKVTGIRAEDFDETQAKKELNAKGWQLFDSLIMTIDDIFYSGEPLTPAEVISKTDTAIAKFHAAYISWLNDYYDQYEGREGPAPCEHRNSLQSTINSLNTDDLIKHTALTAPEVEAMKKGCLLPISSRSKLLEANSILAKAHQETRSKLLEKLCDELRHSGLTEGESERVKALTEIHKKPSEVDAAVKLLREIRANF